MSEATSTPSTPVAITRKRVGLPGGVADRRLAALPAPKANPEPQGRRSASTQVGGVTREPKLPTDAQAIVAAVRGESQQQSADLSKLMREVADLAHARHCEHAKNLLPIGERMTRVMLDDYIEIGRRLLAGRGVRS